MRLVKASFALALAVIVLNVWAGAGLNQYGVAEVYKIAFSEKVRVADTVLPAGDYEIRHTMEGSSHVMVFRQVGGKKPVEVRVPCTLVPLQAKAENTQKIFELNAANERVLRELVFRGDKAKHVF
jgi:hypothetical protein